MTSLRPSSPFEGTLLILRRILAVGLIERLIHGARGVLAHGRHPVRVAVEGELNACVPCKMLDEFGVHASAEKQREARVPEVVPTYVG